MRFLRVTWYYNALNGSFHMQSDSPRTAPRLALTASERRASISLASLFASRMLGLFLLLPVFAVAAQSLEGAWIRLAWAWHLAFTG